MRVTSSLRSGIRSSSVRLFVVVLAALAALTSSRAEAAPASSPGGVDDPALTPEAPTRPLHEAPIAEDNDPAHAAFSLGALAGVGFPRPLSFEVFARFGGYVGLGAEYGLLPTVTWSGVDVSSWAATGDLRIFPFRNAFFIGLRGGYQRINADASVSVTGVGSASGSGELGTWFVNPRIGFLATVKYGFAIAVEAGVQLPVTSSFSSTLPAAVALQVRESTPVSTLSGVLPTVDLLRIGMMF